MKSLEEKKRKVFLKRLIIGLVVVGVESGVVVLVIVLCGDDDRGEVLLQKLRTENRALKSKLIHMDGCGHLVVAEPPVVPRRASHDTVTQIVRDELKLYYSLRRRIKAHGGEA